MTARIIDLAYYNATRRVENDIARVRDLANREAERIKRDTDDTRARILAALDAMDRDVQRPCDSEAS